jgi:hypothetical protein
MNSTSHLYSDFSSLNPVTAEKKRRRLMRRLSAVLKSMRQDIMQVGMTRLPPKLWTKKG